MRQLDQRQDAATAPASNDGPYIRPIRPLQSWKAHWPLGIAVALIAALLGLPLAWWKGRPIYRSEASVLIAPRFEAYLEDDEEVLLQSNSQYRQFVQQNVRTIPRFDIVRAALDSLDDHVKQIWVGQGDSSERAVRLIQSSLQVHPVPDTYQVTIGIDGDSPEGLAETVNAVVASFLSSAEKEEIFDAEERVESLLEERLRLSEVIRGNFARRAEISQKLGVSVFTESFPNPYDQLLVGAKEALARARREAIAADSSAATLRSQDNPDAVDALTDLAADQASGDAKFTSLLSDLAQRKAKLLAKRSGLTVEHPGRRAIDRELGEIEEELAQTFERVASDHSQRISSRRESLAFERRRLEKRLESEVRSQQQLASWYTALYQEATELGKDIQRARVRLDRIDNRIDFLRLESKAPGFLRVFSEARMPAIPIAGGRKKLGILVLAAAALLGICIPLAFDLFDPRVHTVGDLEAFLRSPSMGSLPSSVSTTGTGSTAARRIGALLAYQRVQYGTQIIVFSGAEPEARVGLAVNDIRAALNSMGVSAVLVPALDSKEHALGTDIKSFVSSLHELSDQHDLVLVEAPPLAESADTEYLVRFVDAAVLLVPAGLTFRGVLTTLGARMERLAPKAFGTILLETPDEPPSLISQLFRGPVGPSVTQGPDLTQPITIPAVAKGAADPC